MKIGSGPPFPCLFVPTKFLIAPVLAAKVPEDESPDVISSIERSSNINGCNLHGILAPTRSTGEEITTNSKAEDVAEVESRLAIGPTFNSDLIKGVDVGSSRGEVGDDSLEGGLRLAEFETMFVFQRGATHITTILSLWQTRCANAAARTDPCPSWITMGRCVLFPDLIIFVLRLEPPTPSSYYCPFVLKNTHAPRVMDP